MARFKLGKLGITLKYVVAFDHADQTAIDNAMSELDGLGIKYKKLTNQEDCINNGCLKRTGLGTVKQNGNKIVSFSFQSWKDMAKFESHMAKKVEK